MGCPETSVNTDPRCVTSQKRGPHSHRGESLKPRAELRLAVSEVVVQNVQLKSGPYLVFTKKYPFVHLIIAKICRD